MNQGFYRRTLGLALTVLCSGAFAFADQPFSINDGEFEKSAESGAAALREAKKLVPLTEFVASLPKMRASLELKEPFDQPLSPPDLADRLRASTLAVGVTYYCEECKDWHVSLATGFVVAPGILATSLHVFEPDSEDDAPVYPVAVDSSGRVFAIDRFLAVDAEADTCLVQMVDALEIPSLPVKPGTRTGDPVWIMSHPDTRYFRFSEGHVARIIFERRESGEAISFLDVTAEFAPGSSGGPVADAAGNVVGHVSAIAAAPLAEDGEMTDGSAVVERLCVDGASIMALAREGKNSALPDAFSLGKKSRN